MNSKSTGGDDLDVSEMISECKTVLRFEDNRLLALLYGEHDQHLARIEESFGIRISCRGNRLSVAGLESSVLLGVRTLNTLYSRLEKNLLVNLYENVAYIFGDGDISGNSYDNGGASDSYDTNGCPTPGSNIILFEYFVFLNFFISVSKKS